MRSRLATKRTGAPVSSRPKKIAPPLVPGYTVEMVTVAAILTESPADPL